MIDEESLEIESFLRLIDKYHRAGWIYRGVSDSSYRLLPKLGRPEFQSQYSIHTEHILLRTFKQRAIRHVHPQPTSELEWLAVGQHHDLPTRLLDWTYSPLVALYFAIRENESAEAAVYCRHMIRSTNDFDPLSWRLKNNQGAWRGIDVEKQSDT